MLPLHGRPTASVTRRARMQKPTQNRCDCNRRGRGPSSRRSELPARPADLLLLEHFHSRLPDRLHRCLVHGVRRPLRMRLHPERTPSFATDGMEGICVVTMRGGCCGAAKWNDFFGFFVRDTRTAQRLFCQQHDVTPSARAPVLSPARFRLSHGPLRGGTDSSVRGQGFWRTLTSVDRAKRAGSPLNRPSVQAP